MISVHKADNVYPFPSIHISRGALSIGLKLRLSGMELRVLSRAFPSWLRQFRLRIFKCPGSIVQHDRWTHLQQGVTAAVDTSLLNVATNDATRQPYQCPRKFRHMSASMYKSQYSRV